VAGTLKKVGENKWLVRVYLGRDERGVTRHYNKTVRGTKKVAQKFLNKKLTEFDTGTLIKPTNESLNAHLKEWMRIVAKSKVRPRTADNYDSLIKSHITDQIGKQRLAGIKVIDIETRYSEMLESGYSPKTIRHVHNVLSSAFEKAIDWEKIYSNPCKRVKLPKLRRNEMKFLTQEETLQFLNAAKEDRYYTLFLIAILTGMRPEEYLALLWSDIDFKRNVLYVRRVLVSQKGGGFVFDKPKTAKSERCISLRATATNALKAYKMIQIKHIHGLKGAYQDNDLVFATEIGTPIQHRNLDRRHFKKILARANEKIRKENEGKINKAPLLPSIRLYDLRHTATTLMQIAGVNLKAISDRLGHASSVLTLDTYSHVTSSMQEDCADRVERLMFGT
jgi:integrase